MPSFHAPPVGLKCSNAERFFESSHVIRAAQNPINLDERQANAVGARIEVDLRLGAIFTRFQTLTLQQMGGDLAERVVSYGLYQCYIIPSIYSRCF